MPGMSKWKNGFEFESKQRKRTETTTKRRRHRRHQVKQGTFQKNVGIVVDAPSLISVVTAKPDIKERAAAEAEARERKFMQRRLAGRKKVDRELKQRREKWTKPLTGQDVSTPPGKAGKKLSVTKSRNNQLRNTRQKIADHSGATDQIRSKHAMSLSHLSIVEQRNSTTRSSEAEGTAPESNLPKSKSPIGEAESIQAPFGDGDTNVTTTTTSYSSDTTPPHGVDDKKGRKGDRQGAVPRPHHVTAERERQPNRIVRNGRDDMSATKSFGQSLSIDGTSEAYSSESICNRKKIVLEFLLPSHGGSKGIELPVDLETFGDLSSVGSWPSIESDDSYDTRMNKMMQRWVDLNGGFDSEENYSGDNQRVELVDNVLDHLILAAPDLEEAMEVFEQLSGIKPTIVGPLQGLGARTAHVGLDHNRYIEIIAPHIDWPGQLGEELRSLPPGVLTPYHYSIRSTEVSRLIEGYIYDVLGWDPDHIVMVQGLQDDSIRQWDLLTMYGHDVGGIAPMYVRYTDESQHPTTNIDSKATLQSCTVRAAKGHAVHKLISDVGGVNVEFADHPSLEFAFNTPKGSIRLRAERPKGLVFPGYTGDSMASKSSSELLPFTPQHESS